MTQDEIIEMASKVGLSSMYDASQATYSDWRGKVLAFAKLVAAKERAEITLIAQDLYFWDDSESLIKQIRARCEA